MGGRDKETSRSDQKEANRLETEAIQRNFEQWDVV